MAEMIAGLNTNLILIFIAFVLVVGFATTGISFTLMEHDIRKGMERIEYRLDTQQRSMNAITAGMNRYKKVKRDNITGTNAINNQGGG